MPDIISESSIIWIVLAVGLMIGLHLAISIYTVLCLRSVLKERHGLNRELFGLVKKIEGLTASRREQMLKHYDGLLEGLSSKLPTAVATHTSQVIFDAESKILSRLAELEPNLVKDENNKQKLDELIKSMEGLERTIVNLTSDAVRNVMIDGRRAIFDGNSELNLSLDS